MEPLVGRRFGEFTVRELLSSGGFAQVFRAEQPALSREAVIKVLHARHQGDEHTVQRFLREAQLASRLDHPYAAHIYAFGAEPDGVLWIAMELVRGTPLDRLLAKQGPISLERFVPLLDRLCEVIHTAHEQGIVHRDLKPGNVMVLARAGRLLPKLLDLGIAKHGDEAPQRADPADPADPPNPPNPPNPNDALPSGELAGGGRLTEHGAQMGSPLYMAPELWVDAGLADARTDQYALGVLAYEALTGKPPFIGTTRLAIARAHAKQPPPVLGDGLPRALDDVLGRAMAKPPPDRFASVLDFAAAFRAASGVGDEPSALPRLPEAIRVAVETGAPQPLAQAVASLEAARNPHQARDAIWRLAHVAARLVGVTALAGHAHVGTGASTEQSATEALRRLARRAIGDADWLDLAAALCRPFVAIKDAHPVPELVALTASGAPALRALVALRVAADEALGASDAQVRDLLDRAVPQVAAVLDELAFFADYPLVVAESGDGELWTGVRASARPRVRLRGKPLAAGQPALVDADGVSVLALWPYVQRLAPSPGAPEQLFFFEGKGRRGARMVALPDAFEREDDALWDAFGANLRETSDAGGAPADEERCPFPGLAAFTRDDGARFFGRERETEAFANRLRVEPLLAVIGPSGAGKSSFVQAGVLPGLPESWDPITVRPGPSPFTSLAAKLGADPAALAADPDALGETLRHRAEARGTILLVVDQLEELFTLCDDADLRDRYATSLARAARAAEDPVRIVFTLRDDFLLHAEALPAFRSRLGHGLQLLTTPAAPELRRILVEPITRAGYEFDDPALPDEMVAALADTPGALALLSFTAEKLWELRDRRFRQLGKKAYESLGGVGGALAQHAEDTLRAMPPEEQGLVREVFRHAVTANGTRAVLSRAELEDVLGGGPHAAAVIEKLVAARLLVASEHEEGERVEITHEALLDAWPRLVVWRREDAEGAQLRDQLRAAARQWDERGRAAGLLWRGDALTELRLWRARTAGALTATEQAFADASFADATRGRRWRVGLLASAFVVLVAGIVGLSFLETRATSNARELHDNLQHQYEDQGRRLVLAGEPLQALAYLAKAAELGASGAGHDFLIASAIRATDGELVEVHHDGPVRWPRFSPDGKRLVTSSLDHTAKVWDASTGALLHTLPHHGIVARSSFSPDGKTIATASFDHTAALWDASTGAPLHTFQHGAIVWCATFSLDGRLLLTASDDDAVDLWDVATGALRVALHGDGAGFHACAFSPDGTAIAIGDNAGATRVWDVASGRSIATMHGQHGFVRTLAYSPDGTRIAAASVDGTVVEYEVASGRTLQVLVHGLAVFDVMWSPDGRRLVSGANDNLAIIWDADTGARLVTLAGHVAGVSTVAFIAGGTRVVTTSADATARLWDATTGRSLAHWIGHHDMIVNSSLDPTGSRLVTASEDGSAIVWNVQPSDDTVLMTGHTKPVDLATFSPDGTRVLSAGRDETIRLWDAATGRALLVLRGHRDVVSAARFSPDGALVASVGADSTVRLWDAATGGALAVLTGHAGNIADVSWAPDGRTFATGGADSALRIWSRDGRLIRTISPPGHYSVRALRFTPSGAQLAVTGDDNSTRFYDPVTGRAVAMHHFADSPNATSFDPTGTMAASPVADRGVRVWDVASGQPLHELVGHLATTNTAEWSPDGRFIVSSALDGTARIWDAATGEEIATLAQARQVLSASFSPDGASVVVSTNEGGVAIRRLPRWHGSSAELDRLVRCRVPFSVRDGRLVATERDQAACTP